MKSFDRKSIVIALVVAAFPSISSTNVPNVLPSTSPTVSPTDSPSLTPSEVPSDTPTAKPSPRPSLEPSAVPSESPTHSPTMSIKPSPSPSAAPIIPSPKPSVAPTITPSGTPTTPLPTQGPTIECVDSGLRLRLRIQEGTKRISRTCKWVASKDTENRCALDGVEQACPVTCGTCSVCEDASASVKFVLEVEENIKNVVKSCKYAARKATKQRCVAMGNGCRKTCEKC